MRRMNYPRFDKPTYVGEIGSGDQRGEFYLDHSLENGIYIVVITDPVDGDTYTMHLTVKDNLAARSDFISAIMDSRASIWSHPDTRNIIGIDQDYVSQGSTIELYKLN